MLIGPVGTIQLNSNQNSNFLIHENAIENVVWEMADILSRGDELKQMYCIFWVRN